MLFSGTYQGPAGFPRISASAFTVCRPRTSSFSRSAGLVAGAYPFPDADLNRRHHIRRISEFRQLRTPSGRFDSTTAMGISLVGSTWRDYAQQRWNLYLKIAYGLRLPWPWSLQTILLSSFKPVTAIAPPQPLSQWII